MRIKGIVVAALAVTLTLAACTTGSAFTAAHLDVQLTANIEQIVAEVEAGEVSDEMLERIDNTIAQIDDLLDAGAVNELELLEARAQLIEARSQVVATNAKRSQHHLVQVMQAPIAGTSSGTTGGVSGGKSGGMSGGTTGGGGMSGGAGAAGGSVGGLAGLAGLAAVGGVVSTTTSNKTNTPGPVASNTLP